MLQSRVFQALLLVVTTTCLLHDLYSASFSGTLAISGLFFKGAENLLQQSQRFAKFMNNIQIFISNTVLHFTWPLAAV